MPTDIVEKILRLKRDRNAVILAHTYQPGEVQDIADFVGDSYGLSVKAAETPAEVIVFCGVMFMAETAAILNPAKEVIIPDPRAGCPMADMITAADLAALKQQYPEYAVLCYVNSPAEVKALSDICVTSSNALAIARQVPAETGILFVPDKHLGSWVQEQTERVMVMWEGFCPTHVRITPAMLARARSEHPHATILIHPEAPRESRVLADQVLSTGGMCAFAAHSDATEFIIGTEIGVLHTLRKRNPQKRFSCVDESITCPNMRRGSLDKVEKALAGEGGMRVTVPQDIADRARGSLEKMLAMSG
ncbi:MAG: quinolinate synthase NadA [Chitinivibrionales bacterium]|nr:quinolinate synthase NadA [Chitinivibrionales bacterium]MBD3396252.1 quinolinate synthase NadA [Chitinivibrionales bacterium]